MDHDTQREKLRGDLLKATRPLLARPTFSGSRSSVRRTTSTIPWLYYDGQLSLTLDEFPKDKGDSAARSRHLEAIVLCMGRLSHTVYERADDGKVEGMPSFAWSRM